MIKESGRAFVIRPFGKKENRDGEEIDFDKIHDRLITPALTKVGLTGGTTGEFVKQGSIHEDMFREILAADMVIADISIHNANAFYELGIRHALRDRYTIMIKANNFGDPHVFDLKPERYLGYDPTDPAESIDELIAVITATLQSEQGDSPVFRLLPGLTVVDPQKVVMVPLAFREKVEQNDKDKDALCNLCNEVKGKSWETEGFRLIGRAQFAIADHESSCQTWERIRKFDMFDIEANQKLATNYQKLKQYKFSEQAAKRALQNSGDWDRAETHSLIGSNYKTQWRNSWESEMDLNERQQKALTSPFLAQAFDAYHAGFVQHRSHYYSGLNAIAMRSIELELGKLHPELWELQFDSESHATFEREMKEKLLAKLIAATDLAIDSSVENYPDDKWARISRADLMLFTSKNPKKVKLAYQQCTDAIEGFNADSLRQQVELYEALGLFEENVNSALEIVNEAGD